MRISNLWNNNTKTTISFEFYPPRDNKAAVNLDKAIDNLSKLKPDYAAVTFGAGGFSRDGSYKLVKKLKKQKGLETVAYLAGYGLGPDDIKSVLNSYKNLGIESIFVIRGDKPRNIDKFTPHPKSCSYASDLITFIKKNYNFCLGAAGYPEGHIEQKNKEKNLEYLKLKVDKGAEYITTQFFYDNKYFFDFVKDCRNIGIKVPIIPGIMPFYSVNMIEALSKYCGATITDEVYKGIDRLPQDNKQALMNFSIEFATKQCRELIKWGVRGLHFYTMNRSKVIIEIIKRLREEGLL